MGEYVGAFLLGNGAILGNVCVLPLYPGFIAFLGGTASSRLSGWIRPFLGLIVFAGMMMVMLALGWYLKRSGRAATAAEARTERRRVPSPPRAGGRRNYDSPGSQPAR